MSTRFEPTQDMSHAQLEINRLHSRIESILANAKTRLVAAEQQRMASGVIELRMSLDVTSLSYVERRAYLDDIFIEYPYLQMLKARVQKCHEEGLFVRAFSSKEPTCIFIAGESNTGKSALMDSYEREFRRIYQGEHTVVPILPVVLPYPASPKSVAINLLKKLGDPNAERGSTAILSSRVADYIRDCRVELIVLDELHHFISRENHRVLESVAEWLKTLIIETKVPVIALGKPTAAAVLDYDEQLRRRFSERYSLLPFSWDYEDVATMIEFRRFLKALDCRLPLAEASQLGSFDVAQRIHYATDGIVGYVVTLISHAADLAIGDGQERITLGHLSRAFLDRIKTVKPKKENPFLLETLDPEQVVMLRKTDIEEDLSSRQQSTKKGRKARASEVLRT